ncbi:MAG: winged helix-turn-helix transcriptional regulator [Actinobacteria bacterium]|nr:winged helix-turn-helix transcriptional regulator [Actinomycetota bacterium]
MAGQHPRGSSFVLELAARTATTDGRRVELPPTEFSLLAVLAARPGEVVTHKELLEEAFGDSAYMDAQDLHWRIWNIRKLIGDNDRTIVRNRRGVGFVLESQRVEVIEGVAEPPQLAPTEVIRLDETESPSALPEPEEVVAQGADTAESAPRAPRFVFSPVALLGIGLLAGLALGGSWLAGYTLSQRGGAPVTNDVARPSPVEAERDAPRPDPGDVKSSQKRPRENDKKPDRRGGGRTFAIGPSGRTSISSNGGITSGKAAPPAGSSNSQNGSGQNGQPRSSGDVDKHQPKPPPPPQPTAQLYHLFNSESGDHIMTTSSSVANQKQAAGYTATLEGGVFTSQERGTVAINLGGGAAHVYRDPSFAPRPVRVTALYRLSSGDDFFYTTSSSAANQAQAQGWTRSTSGYVAT